MKKMKRAIAIVMTLCMLAGAMCLSVYAADDVDTLISAYKTAHGSLEVTNDAVKIADYEKILAAYDKENGDKLSLDTLCALVNLSATYSEKVQGNAANTTAGKAAISTYVQETIATEKMDEAQALAATIQDYNIRGNTSFNGDTATPTSRRVNYAQMLELLDETDEDIKEYLVLFGWTGTTIAAKSPASYKNGAPHGYYSMLLFGIEVRYYRDVTLNTTANNDENSIASANAALTALSAADSTVLTDSAKKALTFAAETYATLEAYAKQDGALSADALTGLRAKAEALDAVQVAFLKSLTGTGLSGTDAMSCSILGILNGVKMTPANLYTIAMDADGLQTVIAKMNAYNVDAPSNLGYREIRESLEALNGTTQSFAKIESFTTLYNAIEATFVAHPDRYEPVELEPDDFTQSVASYKLPYVGKMLHRALVATMNPLLSGILKLAVGDIGDVLYTNSMVSTLASLNGMIYGLLIDEIGKQGSGQIFDNVLGALDETGSCPSVQAMAKHLSEPQFADASAKFAAMESWDDFDAEGMTWGFEDGDREGFMAAAIAALRPITSLIYNYAGVNDYVDSKYNDYTYGAYNTALVPLLEALGCSGIQNYDEYLASVATLADKTETTYSKKQDALGYAIFNPLFNLVDTLFACPLNTLLDLLPRLAYAQESGALAGLYNLQISFSFKALGALEMWVDLKLFDMLGISHIDGLVKMLAGLILPEGFVLPEIDWAKLAYMGAAIQRDSAYIDRVQMNDVKADRADVYVTVMQYLASCLEIEGNTDILKGLLLDAMGLEDGFGRTIVSILLGAVFTTIKILY